MYINPNLYLYKIVITFLCWSFNHRSGGRGRRCWHAALYFLLTVHQLFYLWLKPPPEWSKVCFFLINWSWIETWQKPVVSHCFVSPSLSTCCLFDRCRHAHTERKNPNSSLTPPKIKGSTFVLIKWDQHVCSESVSISLASCRRKRSGENPLYIWHIQIKLMIL